MSADIRPATAADAHGIRAIDPRARDLPDRLPAIERAIATASCLVATDGDAVVGYAVCDRSFFEQPFLSLLVVDEEHRRQGIGAALMRQVESACVSGKLFTSTNASNAAMQRLCEKLGFVRSGWIENLDEGDPEIVYFKRIAVEQPA